VIDKEWLVRRAMQAAPFEACGFIMDDGEIVEIRNESPTPLSSFQMGRVQFTEKVGHRIDAVQAIWHTHPRGSIHPSQKDLEGIRTGAIAPHWDYYIVTSLGVHQYDTSLYAPKSHDHWSKFRND